MERHLSSDEMLACVSIEVSKIVVSNKEFHRLDALRVYHWLAKIAFLACRDDRASGDKWDARMQRDGLVFVQVVGGKQGLADAIGSTSRKQHDLPYECLKLLSTLNHGSTFGKEFAGALVRDIVYKRQFRDHPGQISFVLSSVWNGCWLYNHRPKFRGWLVPSIGIPCMGDIGPRLQPRVALMEMDAIMELVMEQTMRTLNKHVDKK